MVSLCLNDILMIRGRSFSMLYIYILNDNDISLIPILSMLKTL